MIQLIIYLIAIPITYVATKKCISDERKRDDEEVNWSIGDRNMCMVVALLCPVTLLIVLSLLAYYSLFEGFDSDKKSNW